MSAEILTAEALDALPVGSVVMARHAKHHDAWPWSKTGDTELRDGDGERESTAWCCVAYTQDQTAEGLLVESAAIRLLWHGDEDSL